MSVSWRGAILIAAALLAGCQSVPPSADVTRIAFGSCNRSDLPQPLWTPVLAARPDLWIWAGDNVYGDTEDMGLLAARYAEQQANPGYQALVNSVPVTGTWDDHDFGANDADKSYPAKASSQQLFLDFLMVPADSPRRAREGVYHSLELGAPPRQVKVILLDVRYHRDAPGVAGDVLGEAQWAWLESELMTSEARVNLIVSGTQVLPTDHEWERWAAYPQARKRLLALIVASRKPGVILLSGDRHFAELTMWRAQRFYPLYEVTSSGLTHYWEGLEDEPNRYRVGRFFKGLNFGVLEIDWSATPDAMISLQVRDQHGRVRIMRRFPLSLLEVAD